MKGILPYLDNLVSYSASQTLFSKQDMENLIDKVSSDVQSTVRQELEIFYRMAGKLQSRVYSDI